MASSSKIRLQSSDGESHDVEKSVAVELQAIKPMIEDGCADNEIPLFRLPNVHSKILTMVIEYCKMHQDLEAWDARFVDTDEATLFELVKAADYLHNKGLLDLTCQTVTNRIRDMIKGKTPEKAVEEIRRRFGIKKEEKDFALTEEEERRILSIEENDSTLTPEDIRRILGV